MDIELSILLTILVGCFLLLFRNNLIYKYRTRALKETSKKAKAAIGRGDDWEIYHDKYNERGSYNKMLLDISCCMNMDKQLTYIIMTFKFS